MRLRGSAAALSVFAVVANTSNGEVVRLCAQLVCCGPNFGELRLRFASDAARFCRQHGSLVARALSAPADAGQAATPQREEWSRATQEFVAPCVLEPVCVRGRAPDPPSRGRFFSIYPLPGTRDQWLEVGEPMVSRDGVSMEQSLVTVPCRGMPQ